MIVSKHFCGKKLVGFTFVAEPAGCCDSNRPMAAKCCHNETDVHQLDTDFTSISPFAVTPMAFSGKLITLPQNEELRAFPEKEKVFFRNFKPPLLHPDISNWVQSYLI